MDETEVKPATDAQHGLVTMMTPVQVQVQVRMRMQ